MRGSGCAPRAHTLPRSEHELIAAETFDFGAHGLRGTVTDRHHGDHGRHTDDDAQNRQKGPHRIAADLPECQKKCLPSIAYLPGCRLSPATMPSKK